MSKTRRKYVLRLIGRIFILIFCFLLYILKPDTFEILNNMNFFKEFSPFHILWILWVVDILLQIIPIKNKIALGSQKLFANRYQPARGKVKYSALKKYIVNTTKSAYKVMIIWILLIILIGVLYYIHIIDESELFLISVFFYVCDLICVLIWCPFRLIMKNKCCTTCRIFNWDHIMMFSPLIYIGGFFANSLVILSFVAWLVWELCIIIYPERFYESTIVALKCCECTDKLCTQYCQKLRR